MASLKDIRRRISSVKNTQQITRAMKMVAASKLRRAQEAIAGARPFAEKIENMSERVLKDILSKLGQIDLDARQKALRELHPFLAPAKASEEDVEHREKIALLIISSDRGLCGAYNSSVIKLAVKRILEIKADSSKSLTIYFIGKRAYDFIRKRGHEGFLFDGFWAGKLHSLKTDKIANQLAEKFLAGEFDRLEVCFTEFRSAISQTPKIKPLLPLEIKEKNNSTSAPLIQSQFLYKPDRMKILSELIPQQFRIQMYRVIADSWASELGARMTSMDNATRNCGDMISGLTLTANRLRQASITRELMEIIGGAEALK